VIALSAIVILLGQRQALAIDGGSFAGGGNRLARATVAVATASRARRGLDFSRCSGVLIAADRVLTAGHCIAGHPEGAVVMLFDRSNVVPHPFWVAAVSRYYIEPGRISAADFAAQIRALSFDVAVLQLSSPIYGRTPIPLAGAQEGVASSLLLAGAGLSRRGVGLLKTAVLKPLFVTETGLTLARAVGARVCLGDSGGPVVVSSSSGPRLWGVASAVITSRGPCGDIVVIAPARAVRPLSFLGSVPG